MTPPKLLTTTQVANYLNMHTDTIRRLSRADRIPHIKVGRQLRFHRGMLDQWIEKGSPTHWKEAGLTAEDPTPGSPSQEPQSNQSPLSIASMKERRRKARKKRMSDPEERLKEQVEQVWRYHLEGRKLFFESRNGQAPAEPKLTTKRRKLIGTAIKEHGLKMARAAGRGIFLSEFHTGANSTGALWLKPEYCWRVTASGEATETLGTLYLEQKDILGR